MSLQHLYYYSGAFIWPPTYYNNDSSYVNIYSLGSHGFICIYFAKLVQFQMHFKLSMERKTLSFHFTFYYGSSDALLMVRNTTIHFKRQMRILSQIKSTDLGYFLIDRCTNK